MSRLGISSLVALVVAGAALVVWKLSTSDESGRAKGRGGPAAVEVAPVETGAIELRRTFSGALEARSRFVVAASVGGRVERLLVDLGDRVDQGQVVAELDDDEQTQGVAESSAEVAVARANLADATSALALAERELQRLEAMHKRGLASEAEVDDGKARHLTRATAVKVARAQVARASAGHKRARIRSSYAKVIATWSGDPEPRVVARRHVAAGDTVAAGAPLVTVVDLDPLDAVVYVTEREYSALRAEQPATITTDAFPGRSFEGRIHRIAPEFRASSRQARMELEIANPDRLLKPGMFIRAEIVLDRVDKATVIPRVAITTRDGKSGVFVVNSSRDQVAWKPVEVGITEGERVQVIGDGVSGEVVTLGQQLIDDGSPITIPERNPKSAPEDS